LAVSYKWKVVTLILLSTSQLKLVAQDNELKREWSFKGQNGTAQVSATSFRHGGEPGYTALEIFPTDGVVTMQEEANDLDLVLTDLAKGGFNMGSLSTLQFRLREMVARNRLAEFAARSDAWRAALMTRNVAKVYPVVTTFLNASGAYKEWVDVFSRHGLSLEVVGVEEVIMERFSHSGANCPSGVDCKNLLVPTDAFVQMNIGRSRS
jgi:hypothetical protein